MPWQRTGTADTGGETVVHFGTPQSDGAVLIEYGIDSLGRPTYTAAGTTDTPSLVYFETGRFHVREIEL